MNRPNDSARLDAEIASLKHRLEEAEDMRRAITSGEVDAFVVGQEDNRKVLLLAGAYQRYRQVVERMEQGAVTVSMKGDVLFANQRFAEMLGISMSKLFAAPLEVYVVAGDRARLGSFLLVSARNSGIEICFVRDDGTQLLARVALASFSDGYLTLLVTDLRPLHRLSEASDALVAIRDAVCALERSETLDAAALRAIKSVNAGMERLSGLLEVVTDAVPGSAATPQPTLESPSPVKR